MLQLQLNRVDYCKVNAIGTKCMKLMPSSQKETQKVIHFYERTYNKRDKH